MAPERTPDGVDKAVLALANAEMPSASAWLSVLGDKRFLFSESGRSFIMYAVQGRSWVVMGEPVGAAEERLELLWRFRERCDAWGGRAVFYEIGPSAMPDLIELGLTFYKLGEQAYVPLAGFDLAVSARSGLRQAQRRAQRDGATFEVVPAAQVPPLLPELQAISDAWLGSKSAKEKGFSLGRFDPAYLRRFPVALVRKGPQIVAFANLWATPDRRELSIDLMRYRDRLVHDVMDYLFIELMLWGSKARAIAGSTSAWHPCPACRNASLRRCGPAPAPCCSPMANILQFRGPAPIQGEVQAGVGAALPGCPRRARRGGRAGRRDRAGQRQHGRRRREIAGPTPASAAAYHVEVGMPLRPH